MNVIKRIIPILTFIMELIILTYIVIWIPIIFGYRPVPILTGHMEPIYKRGSIIYCKKVPQKELKIGDSISFKNEKNEYTAKRITYIEDDLFEVKGEVILKDKAVVIAYKDIIGRNGRVMIHYYGYFLSIINHNLILFVIISVILLTSNFFLNKKKKNTKNILEEEEIEII